MSQQSSGQAEPGNDDWPDDLWPDDDDDGAPGGQSGPGTGGAPSGHDGAGAGGGQGGHDDAGTDSAQPASPVPPAWPQQQPVWPQQQPAWPQQQRPPRRRLYLLAVVALGAALAGAGTAVGVQAFSSSPTAPTSLGSRPSNLTPGQAGGNVQPGGNGVLAPPGGAGGKASLFMIGKVIAVSSRSITIGGPGHTMTAAITSSTRVTGKVSSISGIRPGDQVSAQITESGGRATVAAIQYPAQAPPGMGAP